MPKLLTQIAGTPTEIPTKAVSAGVADAGKVPELNANGVLDATIVNAKNTSAGVADAGRIAALNASGVLDATIVNAKNTSAGVGDAGKVAALNASGILDDTIVNSTATGGAPSANKVAKLDGSGRLASSLLPVGVGADTRDMVASEAIASGDYVNIHASSGAKVRKADASTNGKKAMGFVLVGGAAGSTVTVYFEGTNTAVTGQTAGDVFLDPGNPGKGTVTAPTGSGQVVQNIGFAVSATEVNFQSNVPIVLA